MMKTTVEGQKRYFGYFTDALGSITTMYRYNPHAPANPNRVVQWYEYDAYGNVDIQSDSAYTVYGSQYMFTGRRYDKESGLYYCKARYYNPELGVFQSHDPLGYIDSMNMYAYCGNNPTNYVDPWGEDVWKVRGNSDVGGSNDKIHQKIVVDVYKVKKDKEGNIIGFVKTGDKAAFSFGSNGKFRRVDKDSNSWLKLADSVPSKSHFEGELKKHISLAFCVLKGKHLSYLFIVLLVCEVSKGWY